MKKCQGCEEEKDELEFPIRKDRSNRLRPYCISCSNDIERKRYKHHKQTNPFKHKCTRARSRSRFLKVSFDLTPEYLESIWTGYCPILNIKLDLNTDRLDEKAVELDRIIPKRGYTQGNVVFMSRKMNRIKNNVSIEELRKLLEWLECTLNM